MDWIGYTGWNHEHKRMMMGKDGTRNHPGGCYSPRLSSRLSQSLSPRGSLLSPLSINTVTKQQNYFAWRFVKTVGLQPWTSIFQFRKTKSRIQFDNIFWFISLLTTTKKRFPEINLHDSELMTYLHVHGRHLPKLLLIIKYYHWCLEIPMGIWINASYVLLNQFRYLEFKKSLHNQSRVSSNTPSRSQ